MPKKETESKTKIRRRMMIQAEWRKTQEMIECTLVHGFFKAKAEYWRGVGYLLIDDSDAVLDQLARLRAGTQLKPWEDRMVYSPFARHLCFILELYQGVLSLDQSEHEMKLLFDKLMTAIQDDTSQDLSVLARKLDQIVESALFPDAKKTPRKTAERPRLYLVTN